jgi:hypothetical protein
MVRPPSTGRQTPVTKSFSMKKSTAAATFSGCPSRCTNVDGKVIPAPGQGIGDMPADTFFPAAGHQGRTL